MINMNKDYLVVIDTKTATASTKDKIAFRITDDETKNILVRLEHTASDIDYTPVENNSDYIITMRIVKPNNDIREIVLEDADVSEENILYQVNLDDDYSDLIGKYKFEFLIQTIVNGEIEKSTTNSLVYRVNKSIFNDVDEVIVKDPEYPILDKLIDEVQDALDRVGALEGVTGLDDYVLKEEGKGLSTNDLTDELKLKYEEAYEHSQNEHAPANAQKNSDITSEEIEAKLTGNVQTHFHNQYMTQLPDNVVTTEELENKGYLTGIPDNVVTTEELENKGYLTGIPDNVVTEDKLTQRGYLTEAEVNALIAEQLGGIENGTY